jgi:hypothetical protein
LNIWIDEAYTLQSTGGGVFRATERALQFELQPPLYFVVLALWRTINDSLFFARLLSALSTAATVWLAGGLAGRFLPGIPSALFAALVAFNPLTVYAAVEARFYAPSLLICALLLRFFYDGYVRPTGVRGARRAYVTVAVIALYTHYFTGFLLVGGAVALLATRRRIALFDYLGGMVVTALLFAPLAVSTTRQVASVAAAGVSQPPSLVDAIRQVWGTFWRQVLPADAGGALAAVRGWISRLAIPLLAAAAILRRMRPTVETVAALSFAITVAAFFIAVVKRLGVEFMRPEHAVAMLLPSQIAAVALLLLAVPLRGTLAAVAAMLVFSGVYLQQYYAPLAKPGDWIRVSRYIEQHESSSEPILVLRGEYVLDFGFHYSGRNALVPLPTAMPESRYDPASQTLTGEAQVARAMAGRVGDAGRFWVVTRHLEPFRGVDVHPEFLERFASDCCNVVRDASFWQVRVRQLEFKPGRKPPSASNPGTEGPGKDSAGTR